MDERVFFLLTKAENSMSVYIKQQFAESGLKVTPGQLGILFLLKVRDMQTMTELSQAMGTDNSAVTRLIDRLEKSRLVERNNSSSDRREYQIKITDAGIAETKGAGKVIAAINKRIQDEFLPGELEDFRKILMRMDALFRQ